MANPTAWTRTVPQISDGDPVNAAVANAAPQVLAAQTAALKCILDSLSAGQQLVLRNAPLAESVPVGSVVYLNSTTLEHSLAVAQWNSLESESGRLFPAESSIYCGVVLDKTADRVGNILMSGMGVLSSAASTQLFNGVSPEDGAEYYLSMLNAGTVEIQDPLLPFRVLQYSGNSIIRVFPTGIQTITHTHRDFSLLSTDWALVAGFDPGIVPVGATYGIDFTTVNALAQNLGESLLPSVGEPTFVNIDNTVVSLTPGIHMFSSLVILDENGIWWFDAAAPDGDMEMLVTSADARGAALLNTIQSLSDVIITVNNNGRVTVDFAGFTDSTGIAGAEVVKNISAAGIQEKGLVVESVAVGAGLNISASQGTGQGDVVITQALFDNVYNPAQLLNLNNAVTDTDGGQVFTLLPKNRESSINFQATLPNLSSATYELYIFANFLSLDSSQDAPVIDSIYLTPTPAVAGVTPVAQAANTFPAFPALVSAGDVYLIESVTAIALVGFSRGNISFRILASNPTKELRLVNAGFRLKLI